MGSAFKVIGFGWLVGVCLLGGGVGGYLLDQRLGLSPFLTLVGIAVGVLVSILGIHRMLKSVIDEAGN
jgi:F0F1-type ATP synthase assembly protein I